MSFPLTMVCTYYYNYNANPSDTGNDQMKRRNENYLVNHNNALVFIPVTFHSSPPAIPFVVAAVQTFDDTPSPVWTAAST